MDNRSDVPESQVIEEQMRQTRASLACKLETLEQRVTGTIEEVSDTVENVRGTVQDTLQSVRGSIFEGVHAVEQFFDVQRQTREHPWLMFGGSVAAGFIAGAVFERLPEHLPLRSNGSSEFGSSSSPPRVAEPVARHDGSGKLASAGNRFQDEISELKGLAIGTTLGLVRDMVMKNVPDQLRPKLAEVIDSVTVKLGGHPVHDLMRS